MYSRRQLVARLGKWCIRKYGRRPGKRAPCCCVNNRLNEGYITGQNSHPMDDDHGPTLRSRNPDEADCRGNFEQQANEPIAVISSDNGKQTFDDEEHDLLYEDTNFDFANGGFEFIDLDAAGTNPDTSQVANTENHTETAWQQDPVDEKWAWDEGYGS